VADHQLLTLHHAMAARISRSKNIFRTFYFTNAPPHFGSIYFLFRELHTSSHRGKLLGGHVVNGYLIRTSRVPPRNTESAGLRENVYPISGMR